MLNIFLLFWKNLPINFEKDMDSVDCGFLSDPDPFFLLDGRFRITFPWDRIRIHDLAFYNKVFILHICRLRLKFTCTRCGPVENWECQYCNIESGVSSYLGRSCSGRQA